MKAILTAFLAMWFALPSHADPAPEGMKEFNKRCPAEHLCPVLEKAYQDCKSSKERTRCVEFVETMRKLSPLYDCQRSFDSTPTVNYIVPALWICGETHRENDEPVTDQYLEFLSKLRLPEARAYFASKEFRRVLDGHYAEMYLEASEKLESELKRGHAK